MAPAAIKRALSNSQSSQSPSQGSQTRPRKRPRTVAPSPSQPSTSSTTTAAPARQTASSPAARAPSAAASNPAPADATTVSIPPPKKRTLHKGKLRRLSTGHPQPGHSKSDTSITASGARPRVREKSTLAGAKVGGKSKDLRDRVEAEQLWIRRPAKNASRTTRQGLAYAGYLKMGVAAFVERGCTTLTLHALGAAIPLCLSLALAIRDAIPGAEPSGADGGERDEASDEASLNAPLVRLEVATGSKDVHDEITPDDEDEDIVYQTRTKSTVSVTLSLAEPLRSSLGAAPPRSAAAASSRAGTGPSRRGKKRGGRGR